MADISEAEAILHLKRALGEIDAGDALPPPLPPVQPKPAPPPAKVPKTAPSMPKPAAPLPPAQPSIGPTPRNEIRQPSSQAPPAPTPRQQQQAQGRGGQQPRPPGMVQGMPDPSGVGGHMFAGMPGPKDSMGPGMPGMPGMPSMPGGLGGKGGMPTGMPTGMPPMGPTGPPRPQGSQVPGGGSAAAAAAAAAAGPGKNQKSFEIAQSKVGTVVGKNAATLNAIKSYSKAQCFVEQHHPEDDRATIYVVGTDKEMAKCKQTVLAICDGSMSVSTLFTLAGVPMPRGGVEDWEPPAGGAPMGAAHAGGPPTAPWGAPAHMMPSGPMATGPPALPPMMLAHMAAAAGATGPPAPGASIPGMPENQQMQQNLNDYYARWWSTYASQQGKEGGDDSQETATAFDKEALQRLAERAAKGIEEHPPPIQPAPQPPMPHEPEATVPPGPPPDSAGGICACGEPYSSGAKFCSECGAKILKASAAPSLGLDHSSAPSGSAPSPSSPPPGPSDVRMGGVAAMGGYAPAAPAGAIGQAPRGPITLKGFLRPAEPQKPKKDDDSVQKMMERLQGNVTQTKQTIAMNDVLPPPPPQQRGVRGGPVLGMMGDEDPRTRADFEFEALVGRMQAAQNMDDIEHVGREILIRFPSFTPQQVADIMGKMDSSPGLQTYQNGDLMAELCRMVLPRLKEFTSSQFTSLTSTLASWTRRPDRTRSPRFQEFSKAFFSAASLEMSSRLMTFAPHELNCCLAAFVSVGFSDHKFFASVGRAALARHSSFAPVQLTALLAILSEMRLVHTDLFNAAAAFLSTRTKELRPVDIIRVLRSFSKCGVQHPVLCRAISDEVIARARDKSVAPFKAEDLCEVSWALCALQFYCEPVIRLMFKALERQPTIASDSLLQVYEVHLALEADHKDSYSKYMPASHLIDALEDHHRDNRKDERRCSERQRNDVASVLKSLVEGSVHVNHRTSFGLLVDVAALRKRSSTDGFIHVDLDSNVTVVRSLDQDEAASAALITEGAVAMRRRILQKNGLRLVTVKESEWRDLDDSKEKRRYLRQLLSNLGDVLQ